jgi:hypothetical protein
MLRDTVDVITTAPEQGNGLCCEDNYRAFAANLKRATAHRRILGSVDLHIPALDLHLHCTWLRGPNGSERLGMPRTKVETPNGRTHLKTLARWGTAQSEERFQRAGLKALHELITATEGDRLSATSRPVPRSRPAPSRANSGSPTNDQR